MLIPGILLQAAQAAAAGAAGCDVEIVVDGALGGGMATGSPAAISRRRTLWHIASRGGTSDMAGVQPRDDRGFGALTGLAWLPNSARRNVISSLVPI